MAKEITTKTYYARDLLDMHLAFNAGGALIRICFKPGSIGSNGLVPAHYVTDNPAIQTLIEKTDAYCKGKITANEKSSK